MSNWQDLVEDVANAINSATSVAGNIASTVQSIQGGTYQNQQQQQQQQMARSDNNFNKLLLVVPIVVVCLVLLIKKL